MRRGLMSVLFGLWMSSGILAAESGNRLAYLHEGVNPYYVQRNLPKLVTPQWVGDDGVQAVIVLAIDDLGDVARYEEFVRPILERLKRIDGRASLSMMTTKVDSAHPQLAAWLKEGVTIEAHTHDHPCPLLQGGKIAAAKSTYDQCIDQLQQVPGSGPIAFRMPCCDSMNSVSPRFFAEIFNKTTPDGRFLSIDTSVFHVFTADDPELPGEITRDEEGQARFEKYIPADKLMVNYIEDYPYPYVIGNVTWELPCLMPSDWDAQHLNGKCSPRTVRDMKAAIDATVIKQGVFSLCFHPHGWISNEQVTQLIDYAHTKYGNQVKFLSFREVLQRLNTNLLDGHALRAADGGDNGVRLVDVDHDGYLDVVIANPQSHQSRIWLPDGRTWRGVPLSDEIDVVGRDGSGTAAQFAVLRASGCASVVCFRPQESVEWFYDGMQWQSAALSGPFQEAIAWPADQVRKDQGLRFRDLDRDGICELIVAHPQAQGVYRLTDGQWRQLPWKLPPGLLMVDTRGQDAGLRFVDFDNDGRDDLVFSNADRCAAYAFSSMAQGWSRPIFDVARSGPAPLPMIVRTDGTNNGVWFAKGHMWVQNEDTGGVLPHHVDHRAFDRDFVAGGR